MKVNSPIEPAEPEKIDSKRGDRVIAAARLAIVLFGVPLGALLRMYLLRDYREQLLSIGEATVSRIDRIPGTRHPRQITVQFKRGEYQPEFTLAEEAFRIGDHVQIEYRERPNGDILVERMFPIKTGAGKSALWSH